MTSAFRLMEFNRWPSAFIVATGMQSELGKITRLVKDVNFWGAPTRPNSESRPAVAWQSGRCRAGASAPPRPPARRRTDDGASEGVTPASGFARTPLRTKLSRTGLRTASEGSRVHPFAFAHLRMAVSERLCWRPIQARAISDRLRGVGQALIELLSR